MSKSPTTLLRIQSPIPKLPTISPSPAAAASFQSSLFATCRPWLEISFSFTSPYTFGEATLRITSNLGHVLSRQLLHIRPFHPLPQPPWSSIE
ncbi:hypothetical protein ACLB2K_002141 [Fragaria x ananassa]